VIAKTRRSGYSLTWLRQARMSAILHLCPSPWESQAQRRRVTNIQQFREGLSQETSLSIKGQYLPLAEY
jgi:hypothetical protein